MKKKDIAVAILLLVASIAAIQVVLSAPPTGPDSYTNVSHERRTNFNNTPKGISAGAGNITKMQINISRVTSYWHGFYGNVSGRITLDDASNWTFFDWGGANTTALGNLFAANESVSVWSQIRCVNFSGNGSGLNITSLEGNFGIPPSSAEGFDETFSIKNNITIDGISLTDCPATNTYRNDVAAADAWNQTLLTINNTYTVIFATQLDDNKVLFNGETGDFQLLVADTTAAGPTNYLLYIELV
jgi:hypothetical protein